MFFRFLAAVLRGGWRVFTLGPLLALLALGCQGKGNLAPNGYLEAMWGQRGLLPGEFVKPRAIAIFADDRVALVDMRAQLQIFDADGHLQAWWQTPTHEKGRPSGLAVDPHGNLAVADSHYGRVLLYDRAGQLLRQWGGQEPPTASLGPPSVPSLDLVPAASGLRHDEVGGALGYIADVVFDRAGNLYLADSHPDETGERVCKIDPQGHLVAQWGGRGSEPGHFQKIRALACGLYQGQERLFVADACNHRIQLFDTAGRLLAIWGTPGSGPGQLDYPYDVALTPDGCLLVCEYGNHRIQRFSPDGKPRGCWGTPGREAGQLWNPWGVGVDSQGRVFVVDSNNHRVQRVRF